MKITSLRVLRGPNVWANCPLLEVALEVPAACDSAWARRLCAALPPGLNLPPRSASGAAEDAQAAAETWAALVAALQTAAWKPVQLARVESALSNGLYRVLVGYEDEELGQACAQEAVALCAPWDGSQPLHVAPAIERLRELAARVCLSGPARAIVEAARQRDIPWRRLSRSGILQLGFGSRERHTAMVAPHASRPVDAEWAERVLHALDVPFLQGTEAELAARGALYRALVAGGKLIAAVQCAPQLGPVEVTDRVDPALAQRCVEACRALELDAAVLEIRADDLAVPLQDQDGGVVGIAAGLGDDAALASAEILRRFGHAIVERLFPEGATGRIPIASVTGVNGKTTTVRLIARLLESLGQRVGMACTDGAFITGRLIDKDDCSGPRTARRILLNPCVDAGVFEVARGGILREGLGFDRADVAVVTNIADGDHLGISWVKTPEDLARVKGVLAESVGPAGHAVLNADDPLVVAMAARCPGRVVYVCRTSEHPVVVAHRRGGGRAVVERDATIVLAEGPQETPVLAVTDIPLTRGGILGFQVENVLAAVAAGWCLGVPWREMRECLRHFDSDVHTCPGRFNVLEHGGATIILDYGHNPAAVKALTESIARLPATRRHVVYSADGDRTDAQIRQQATNLAGTFDRVVLYEEPYRFRGRQHGEIYRLLREGLTCAGNDMAIEQVDGELPAIRHALSTVQPGELVLIQVDAVTVDLAFVKQFIGQEALSKQ